VLIPSRSLHGLGFTEAPEDTSEEERVLYTPVVTPPWRVERTRSPPASRAPVVVASSSSRGASPAPRRPDVGHRTVTPSGFRPPAPPPPPQRAATPVPPPPPPQRDTHRAAVTGPQPPRGSVGVPQCRLTPPVHGTRVAIDWHGTLDKPRSTEGLPVAAPNVAALQKLRDAGYTIWLCSYIGSSGPDSESRKEDFWAGRRYVAHCLGLGVPPSGGFNRNPAGPSRDGIFGAVVSARLGRNGKVTCLQRYDTGVLIDDRQDIARDAEDAGVSVYRIKAKDWRDPWSDQYYSDNSCLRNLTQAVEELVLQSPIRGFSLSHK